MFLSSAVPENWMSLRWGQKKSHLQTLPWPLWDRYLQSAQFILLTNWWINPESEHNRLTWAASIGSFNSRSPSMYSGSTTSWLMSSKFSWPIQCSTFLFLPVKKLSTTVTSWPSIISLSVRWEPTKPAPPVIWRKDAQINTDPCSLMLLLISPLCSLSAAF